MSRHEVDHDARNTQTTESTSCSLVTAVADALDDLDLHALAVGKNSSGNATNNSTSENEYHQALIRAYSDDRGGTSLTIARRLLGMIPKADIDHAVSTAVGLAGIMTWEDIESVCMALGCPLEGPNEEVTNELDLNRKLELTLYLATDVQCRRLLHLQQENKKKEPATATSWQNPSFPSHAPAKQSLEEIMALAPGGSISDDVLTRFLIDSCSKLSPEESEMIVACNRAFQADYAMRAKMMNQKFDATATAFARSKLHSAGGTVSDDKEEGDGASSSMEEQLRRIASGMATLELKDQLSSSGIRGDRVLEQFILPSTKFCPQAKNQIMRRDIDSAYDRGGRIDEDERHSMPAWQRVRKQGSPQKSPGKKKSGAGKNKKKGSDEIEKKGGEKGVTGEDVGMRKNVTSDLRGNPDDADMQEQAAISTPKSSKKKGRGSTPRSSTQRDNCYSKNEGRNEIRKTSAATAASAGNVSENNNNTGGEGTTEDGTSAKRRRRRKPKRREQSPAAAPTAAAVGNETESEKSNGTKEGSVAGKDECYADAAVSNNLKGASGGKGDSRKKKVTLSAKKSGPRGPSNGMGATEGTKTRSNEDEEQNPTRSVNSDKKRTSRRRRGRGKPS